MEATTARTPLTRDAIVAQARHIISTEGLDKLSLRHLGDQLGVTAPALYAHLADKQDLLRAIAELEFEDLLKRFDLVQGTDPLVRIRGYCHAYVQHARADRELFQVMFLFPPGLPIGSDFGEIELPAATKAFAAATSAIDQAVASGAIVAKDPLMVALSLWSATHGVASALQLGLELSPETETELVDEVIGRLLRGYAA